MEILIVVLLICAGLVAGIIDSIAGGGGLITVPLFTLLIGAGSHAIGTNKVAAVAASAFALLIYLRNGHVELRGHWGFVAIVGIAAVLGAQLSPFVPPEAYRWILVIVCPGILWIVYRKEIWVQQEFFNDGSRNGSSGDSCVEKNSLYAAGFLCGFYDGLAGPGGGTLMFLSLLLVAKLPLLNAMATAKLANLASAAVSLASFSYTGHVQWLKGFPVAAGISMGAVLGASWATRRAGRLARTVLLIVASLLILRLLLT